jgi:hypothetical protein
MKRTRSKSKVKKTASTSKNQKASAVADEVNLSSVTALSTRVEETMERLAATARKVSSPIDLLNALLDILPRDQRK